MQESVGYNPWFVQGSTVYNNEEISGPPGPYLEPVRDYLACQFMIYISTYYF